MHTHTPTLAVMDSRGLNVATVSYCRETAGGPIDPRIYRQRYNVAGQLTEGCDPRLGALHQREPDARPNLTVISSLTGVSLSSDSVDGALRLTLPGAAGQRLIAWDGLMTQTLTDYDLLLRPVSIVEHVQGMSARNSGFFSYGGSSSSCAAHNQCGRIVRHDDSAGSEFFPEYSLTGEQLRCVRHFLSDLDEPDWPQAVAERDLLMNARAVPQPISATTR